MRTKHHVTIAATLLALGIAGSVSHADNKANQHKFCSSVTSLNSDLSMLRALDRNSTMTEVKAITAKIRQDADSAVNAARGIKSPAAKQFVASAEQLSTEARNIPQNMTVSQVKSRLQGDAKNVKESARALATESGCPEAIPQEQQGEQQGGATQEQGGAMQQQGGAQQGGATQQPGGATGTENPGG